MFFFFNDTATTEIYTLSLHDALPICAAAEASRWPRGARLRRPQPAPGQEGRDRARPPPPAADRTRRHHGRRRSEEHTSELQSRQYLVCRLLLEKKKII